MSMIQLRFKKDVAFYHVVVDLENILTAMTNELNLDFSDIENYPATDIDGNLPGYRTADKLTVPRLISLTGEAEGSELFDGSKDIEINTIIHKLHTPRRIELEGLVEGYAEFDGSEDIKIFTTLKGSTGGDPGGNTELTVDRLTNPRHILITGNAQGCTNEPGFDGSQDVSIDITVTKVQNIDFSSNDIDPSGVTRLNADCHFYATKVFNAIYNDYAEAFIPADDFEFNYYDIWYRIVEVNNEGKVQLAQNSSKTCIGIVSNNYAMLLGASDDEIQNSKKIPVGLCGTLYVDSELKVDVSNIGKFVYSGNNGKALVSLVKYSTEYDVVGKIIGIDEENNRYKVLLT